MNLILPTQAAGSNWHSTSQQGSKEGFALAQDGDWYLQASSCGEGRRNLQWGVEWIRFCLLSSCLGRMTFSFSSGEQRGVCTRQQIKCDTCKCQSKPYKVYKETEIDTRTTQGRHLAQPNITQYVGLTEMPVSSTSLQLLCSCLNIPSLQKTRNKVADTIVYSDKSDMNTKQEEPQEKLIESQELISTLSVLSTTGCITMQKCVDCVVK